MYLIEFSGILQTYVDALNSPSGIPNVGTAWDMVMETTYTTAANKALDLYKSKMILPDQPLNEDEMLEKHFSALKESIGVFNELTHLDCDGDSHEKHLEKLTV